MEVRKQKTTWLFIAKREKESFCNIIFFDEMLQIFVMSVTLKIKKLVVTFFQKKSEILKNWRHFPKKFSKKKSQKKFF